MEESGINISELTDSNVWLGWLASLQNWFVTTVATKDTLIELAIIATAAAIAWPLAVILRRKFLQLEQHQARYPILRRLWLTLSQVSFPIVWLVIQAVFILVLMKLDIRDGVVVITSSLLTAWVVIRVVTVFVANPLGSNLIALFAWIVAALNIVGLLDETIAFLGEASFNFGEVTISALTVIQGVIALAILLWVTACIAQLLESRIKSSPNLTPSIKVLSAKLLRIVLAIFAFIFALSIVGIDLTAFAVFGGAIGVGLGFGLQKIFANLISGFILLLDKSIKPGDVIAVSDNYGRVDSLGSRYVSVLTRDGVEHLIPNEEMITTRVENWTHSNNLLRIHKSVGVHYKSDLRKAIDLCKEALEDTPRILKEPPPACLLTDFADNSVLIEMRFWIDDPMNGRANVVSPLLLSVWDKFKQHGIEIPYPQRDLHLRSSDIDTKQMPAELSERLAEDT